MSKETIQEYLQEVNEKVWANSPSMQEYCRKKCSDVFKSTGGHFVEFEKPTIKKDFCFGAGQNGITTEEEWERAGDMAVYARTNEDYFLSENLEEFEEWFKTFKENENLYLMIRNNGTKIACIKTERYFLHFPFERNRIVEQLTKKDIEELKKIVQSEKEKFTKRLNTYLKRYGLSKINSWTYLVD